MNSTLSSGRMAPGAANSPATSSIRQAFAVIAGALLLLLPAMMNGYPLVNADDGTYIISGFRPEMPGDRPITYGLLLRVFSLNGVSLWIAASLQALIVSWLLLRVVAATTGHRLLPGVLIIGVLSLLTPLSWVTSEIIPDICTPIALLAAFLLWTGGNRKWLTVLLFGIYTAAVATHISHLMIFTGLIVLFMLGRRYLAPHIPKRVALGQSGLLLLATAGTLVVMVRAISVSGHVFSMAALLDQGILKTYLDERCPVESYKLCRYKDGLGTDPNFFIWNEESPLYKEGGWASNKAEYNTIIKNTWTSPRYVSMHVRASWKATIRQLTMFGIGDGNVPFPSGSQLYQTVEEHVPNDIAGYGDAAQHAADITRSNLVIDFNRVIYGTVIASLGVLLILCGMYRKRLPHGLRLFIGLSLAGILINAWACGTFSNVLGRYGCRMIWLLPFCALLGLLHMQNTRKRIRTAREANPTDL